MTLALHADNGRSNWLSTSMGFTEGDGSAHSLIVHLAQHHGSHWPPADHERFEAATSNCFCNPDLRSIRNLGYWLHYSWRPTQTSKLSWSRIKPWVQWIKLNMPCRKRIKNISDSCPHRFKRKWLGEEKRQIKCLMPTSRLLCLFHVGKNVLNFSK